MILIIQIIKALLLLSIMAILLSWLIYLIIKIREKITHKDIINNTLRKIYSVILWFPLIIIGLYFIALIFTIKFTSQAKILLGLSGIFLITLAFYKIITRIHELDSFGDV